MLKALEYCFATPPTNSSKQTLDEIKFIQKLVANATDEVKQQFINCDHDPYYIKEVLSENNFDYKDETIEKLEKSIKKPIYNHYSHFNRPRPYQVAEFLNMQF